MKDSTGIIQDGSIAKQILESVNELDIFARYEAQLFQAWKKTNLEQREEREEIFRAYKAMQNFRTVLTGMVNNGKIEESVTSQKEKTNE